MTSLEKAITLIEKEQSGFQDSEHGYWLCEQIKEICRMEPDTAELIAQDLTVPEMRIRECLKKLDAYANAHKSKDRAIVPPQRAEEIIRKFYGLPKRPEMLHLGGTVPVQPQGGEIAPAPKMDTLPSLFDLLEGEV